MTPWTEWTNESFLEYVLWHSQTPRSLFSRDMVKHLQELAGESTAVHHEFVTLDHEYALDLVGKARARNP